MESPNKTLNIKKSYKLSNKKYKKMKQISQKCVYPKEVRSYIVCINNMNDNCNNF